VSTPPADDRLPQRLRAQSVIRDGEAQTGRAWFRALQRFLDRVRPSVRSGGGIDPGRVSDHAQYWTDQVNVEIVPTIGRTLGRTYRRVLGRDPERDPFVAQYLNEAGNRLVRIPDEVYALIVTAVEEGIRRGQGVDDVAEAVDEILTATGSERWRNRAITVARTETMGAVNAGVYRSAVLSAREDGDFAPMKVWLATDDNRTRPTHNAADKQRTLLESPFVVGGADLLFPGDPRGPAGEVINCRCTMLPVVLGQEIDWTDRQDP